MNDAARFVEDMTMHALQHAVVLRSPVSAGRLEGIDAPRMPHAYTLVRAADIPGKNFLEGFSLSMSVLASDTLSYLGEPVALLVGPDPSHLERYAAACAVRAREEKPQYSCEKFSSDRLASKRTVVLGDPDRAFKAAALVTEGTYRTGIQEHWYPEPHSALASFSYDKMLINVGTQWPFLVRRAVAAVLGVSQEDVIVEAAELGFHLDGKLWYPALVAAHAALGAFVCRKPVKLVLSRDEDMRFSPKRPASEVKIRSAVGKNGELLALEARTVLNVGSGGPFAEEMLDRHCLGSVGAYRCPNIRMEGFAVRTNLPPAGPFAGLGLSQASFAVERHVSRIADELGRDPAQWRQEHALGRGDRLITGNPLRDAVPSAELIDAVCAMSDYRRKWASYRMQSAAVAERRGVSDGPLRGIGLSFAYQGNGFLSAGADRGNFSVEATLGKDGTLEIRTSAVPSGAETCDIWRRIAAEELAMDMADIVIVPNRTDLVPDSGPASLSRNITVVTKLIERCCTAVRKQRFRDPLPITVRRAYRPPRTAGFDAALSEGSPFLQLGWGAAVVETEVDPLDYTPKVRGVWLLVDGGRILSESRARASLTISAMHALSWASRERLEYRDGRLSSDDVAAYDIPAVQELPPIRIDFSWTEAAGPKGIGELPFSTIPAAFAQAVSQATAASFDSLPISAAAIREALQ